MVLVVGGGGFLGLLLALGYVFYWSPKLKAEAAQDEIRAWGEHWASARSCLVGASPQSSDPAEAMLARELVDQNLKGSLGRCLTKLKPLARAEGASSENMAIEKAWYQHRIPVSKISQEHAWRIARTPNKTGQKLRANLARAIGDLDASHTRLRGSANLEAVQLPGTPMAKAGLFTTLAGPDGEQTTGVTELSLRNNQISYRTRSSQGEYRASLKQDADAPHFKSLSPLALRAVTGDWGLWLEEDGIPVVDRFAREGAHIFAGPLDDLGEPGGDGVKLHTLAKNERVELSYAIGAEKRTALYRIVQDDAAGGFSWSYRLVGSSDTGGTWSAHQLPEGEMWANLAETGDTSYIASTDPENPMTLVLMTISIEGISERRVTFPGTRNDEQTWPPDQCLAPTRAWWIVGTALYTMGPDGALVAVPGEIEQGLDRYTYQFQCGDTYAGVHAQPFETTNGKLHYQSCTLDGCTGVIKTHVPTGDTITKHVFHKGAWLIVQELDGVLALWNGAKSTSPPRFLRMSSPGPLAGVVSWGDSLVFATWPQDAAGPTLLRAE
jgi:hypothetical protein